MHRIRPDTSFTSGCCGVSTPWWGGDPLGTVQLLARLLSTLTIPLVYAAVKILRPREAVSWAFAAGLTAFQPFLLFHAVDGQTHTSEAFAAALLLVAVLRYRRRPSIQWAVVLGMLLALGSSLRPSFIVAGIGPDRLGDRIPTPPPFGSRWRDQHRGGVRLVVADRAGQWRPRAMEGRERCAGSRSVPSSEQPVELLTPSAALSCTALPVPRYGYFFCCCPQRWRCSCAAEVQSSATPRTMRPAPSRSGPWPPAAVFHLATFISEPGYLLGAMPSVVVLTVVAASGIPTLALTPARIHGGRGRTTRHPNAPNRSP